MRNLTLNSSNYKSVKYFYSLSNACISMFEPTYTNILNKIMEIATFLQSWKEED